MRLREALGSEIVVHLAVDARPAVTDETQRAGTRTSGPGAGHRWLQADGRRPLLRALHVSDDEPVEAAVDTRSLHFFDPETGLGIYDQTSKGAVT